MNITNTLSTSLNLSLNSSLYLRLLFFFSGIPALLYQITWQRALFRIFGVNTESVTIVVTAFMIGLGIGSYIGGKISNNSRFSPLQLFIGIELLTALFGALSLIIFGYVEALVGQLSLFYTGVVTLSLIIIPTILMGATLPILINHLVRKNRNVGYSVGSLYCVNTLGAAAACFLAISILFPFGGMLETTLIAAVINVLIGLGAIYLFRIDTDSNDFKAADEISAAKIVVCRIPFALSCLFVFISGYITLSFEILFFRVIGYTAGNPAWVFPLTLGEFLLGLAIGSYITSNNFKLKHDHTKVAVKILFMLVAANLLGLLFLPSLAHLGTLGWGILGIALLFVLLIAILWGGVFPLFAHLGIAANKNTSSKIGLLYLINILGAATGSLTTGFVLMNTYGVAEISALLVVLGSVSAIALFFIIPSQNTTRITGVALSVSIIFITLNWHQDLSARVLHTLDYKSVNHIFPQYKNVIENRNGIITVSENGEVKGDGRYDGKFSTSLVEDVNIIVRAYALGLYHESPKKVLMIGLATGSWAKVVANHPDVESLTVIEINPGYVETIAVEPEVQSILSNRKVKLVVDDGRRWMRNNPLETFDAIIMNTTFHTRSNVTNLLSLEFQARIKKHLNPGGTFFFNTTSSNRAQKTSCRAFPFGYRFLNSILVSSDPLMLDFERWKDILMGTKIDGKVVIDPSRESHAKKLAELMSFEKDLDNKLMNPQRKRIENCMEILNRTAGLELITDNNMGEEWKLYSAAD